MRTDVRTVGVLGAGRVGTAIARQALKAGCEVRIATARPPSEIALLVDVMVPGATAVSASVAARDSDLVILALPLTKYRTLSPEDLAGKVAIDVMNYWAPTDGTLPEFEGSAPSTEIVQQFLPQTRLVRTLNHVGYHEIEDDARPVGHPERRALAVAGGADARAVVAAFIERLGFDAVDAGELAAGRYFANGTTIFQSRLRRDEMERMLGQRDTRANAAA